MPLYTKPTTSETHTAQESQESTALGDSILFGFALVSSIACAFVSSTRDDNNRLTISGNRAGATLGMLAGTAACSALGIPSSGPTNIMLYLPASGLGGAIAAKLLNGNPQREHQH